MNIVGLLVSFAFLMVAMSIHEFSHGWIAYKLGDTTAKDSGRLTLNPFAHIDIIGTVMLPLFLFWATNGQFVFGAAKPVPINYHALGNPKRDMLWIGLAGPLANFTLAAVLGIVNIFFLPSPASIAGFVLEGLILVNVVLGVFNLIPIPPLDGSRILMGILPRPLAYRYALLEPFGFIIVILLIWLGAFNSVVWPVVRGILRLLKIYF